MKPTSPTAWQVLLHLLRTRPRSCSAYQIARDLNKAQGPVNDLLRFLEYHGGLVGKTRELRWGRTAEVAARLRFAAMVPARRIETQAAVDPEAISSRLTRDGVSHALAYRSAANHWAFFEPEPRVQIVVSRPDLAAAVRSVGPDDAPSASDGPAGVDLFVDHLEVLEVTTRRGLPVTTRLQTWLDLQHFPLAGAHAAFFRSVLAAEFPDVEALR